MRLASCKCWLLQALVIVCHVSHSLCLIINSDVTLHDFCKKPLSDFDETFDRMILASFDTKSRENDEEIQTLN